MKRFTYLSIITTIGILCFSSCKNEVKNDRVDQSVATDTIPAKIEPVYMYVTAVSGLTLRDQPNLQSEKLAIMPLGTKVKLLTHNNESTMNIGGISGAMDEVEFNDKKGFVFNGFISKYTPSGANAVAKNYFEDLKNDFPDVEYSEVTGGTVSKPSKTQTTLLPTDKWHEGFFMAQQLYGIPRQFAFPNPTGSNNEVQKNNNSSKNHIISELQISRRNNTLKKIIYYNQSQKLESTVTITKEGNKIKIEKVETVN